ncbi:MAG: DUF5906 domain-containing protein [Stenotrophomonas sp.]
MAANYDDVVGQLRDAGLIVDSLDTSGKMVRTKVENERERRGWYVLHELQTSSNDVLVVGTFGVWRGNDNGAMKVELRKRDAEFSQEQRDALRRRQAEDRKRAERARQAENAKAAARAAKAWTLYSETGESPYLISKAVQGFGLRYTRANAAVLPLQDANGTVHGLQFLRTADQARAAKRPAKEFWPAGLAKKGHFHLIGTPQWIVLVAEGYATAATLHMATGYPVAVAFDAGNIGPVAAALHKRYSRARILICADDDILQKCRHPECKARLVLPVNPVDCPSCGKPHGASNAGVTSASAAAMEVKGGWMLPRFAAEEERQQQYLANGRKVSDFNDLQATEGLNSVRGQVEARLLELSWAPPESRAPSSITTGGAGKGALTPIGDLDTLLKRFVLVYAQGGTVFDHQEHMLLSLSDMRDACQRRELHRAWVEHPDRGIVRVQEVDFDPSQSKPGITCNLFAGWPTTPKQGNCEKLLHLLWHMCGNEANQKALYEWVLRWLAYPLQHPGAKMKSTIVIHGPQGTGKNMFFDEYMKLYGEYGRVLDQSALEDKFNDWASRKLFLLADEVVARTEVYHLKNKLKALITGDRIRINPKNIAAYEEDNHANLVFLSNEAMPVVLEEDDRRHAVLWTPVKLDEAFYRDALAEIRNGGTAALHHYLLSVDLTGFTNGSNPPMTDAKRELIGLSLDSPQRFLDELYGEDIPGIKPRPAPSKEWYELYKIWCAREGVRPAPGHKFINALVRKRDVVHPERARKRYLIEQTTHGPHGFLLLGNATSPDSRTETTFLGDEVVAFRVAFNEYKGRA